jgi:hypothetical protein
MNLQRNINLPIEAGRLPAVPHPRLLISAKSFPSWNFQVREQY